MYLFVNPSGTRHVLCETFKQVLDLMKNAKDGSEYTCTVLDSTSAGTYDMIISRITETVSKKQYIKAHFVKNPTNVSRNSQQDVGKLLFGSLFALPILKPDEKSFDALTLLLDSFVVNGYLSIDADIPHSVLDDFTTLTATLDDFFKTKDPRMSTPVLKVKDADPRMFDFDRKDTARADSQPSTNFFEEPIMAEVKPSVPSSF
jgi:hypothetical protein